VLFLHHFDLLLVPGSSALSARAFSLSISALIRSAGFAVSGMLLLVHDCSFVLQVNDLMGRD